MVKISLATFVYLLIAFASILTMYSCVEHNLPKSCESSVIVSFEAKIKPIITANCAIQGVDDVCHNGDNGADIDWRVLSNFQNHASEVKRRIRLPKSNGDHMPREGSITESEIQLIVCWVEQGAQDN